MLRKAARKFLSPLLYNLTSAEMGLSTTTYSQFGEDLLAESFFKNQNSGTYIDIGSFHPIYLSNTYKLYKKGWRGLVIDPNPELEPLYKRFRDRDKFINCAVGESSTSAKYRIYENGVFNSIKPEGVKNIYIPSPFVKEIIVKVMSISELIKETNYNIDFLNIDCEGMDLEILQSFPFNQSKPKLIAVEDHSSGWLTSDVTKFLQKNCYSVFGRCVLTTFFSSDGC